MKSQNWGIPNTRYEAYAKLDRILSYAIGAAFEEFSVARGNLIARNCVAAIACCQQHVREEWGD